MKISNGSRPTATVWIEINPAADTNEAKHAAAKLATNMILKLGITLSRFEYSEKNDQFIYVMQAGDYMELPEQGHRFNLEFLGK